MDSLLGSVSLQKLLLCTKPWDPEIPLLFSLKLSIFEQSGENPDDRIEENLEKLWNSEENPPEFCGEFAVESIELIKLIEAQAGLNFDLAL